MMIKPLDGLPLVFMLIRQRDHDLKQERLILYADADITAIALGQGTDAFDPDTVVGAVCFAGDRETVPHFHCPGVVVFDLNAQHLPVLRHGKADGFHPRLR